MDEDIPDIGELEPGDTARIEYVSKRSGNPVEREGEVAEATVSDEGNPFVYIHDRQDGFFSHTFIQLAHAKTTEGNRCIAAVSVSTEPDADVEEPPTIGRHHYVQHSVARQQTLGIVREAIRVTPESLTPNDVL